MKRIAIFGLCNYDNIGDQIIPKTVGYLLGMIPEVEYKYVNFLNTFGKRYEKYSEIRKKIQSDKKIYELMRIYSLNEYCRELVDMDGIIVACGSFKYTTQYLWASYCIILEAAKLCRIPVMFNAMSIQEYDEKDWRSCMLKIFLNNGCTRLFTTRDGQSGLEKLKKGYIDSKMDIGAVGDPALATRECYLNSEEQSSEEKVIVDINVIRPNIFIDYGGNISEEKMLDIYIELIHELEKKEIEWRLFSNGLNVDEEFGGKILEKVNAEKERLFSPKSDIELVSYISKCKAIIGARMHACIVAYALDIPFVGYIWDEKILHFAEDNELLDCFCTEELLSGNKLLELLEDRMASKKTLYKKNFWKRETQRYIEQFISEI